MGRFHGGASIPAAAPIAEDQWGRSSDDSTAEVSFGFIATAILISMFLFMAVFERLLQPRSSSSPPNSGDEKFNNHSSPPKVSFYQSGVSVLMPGETVPTYIARPAPPP